MVMGLVMAAFARPIQFDAMKPNSARRDRAMFHYPCTKSSSQTFSHPLQYEIRFVQDVEFPDDRMRRRVLLREKRPVAPCQ
jgi:hypothetical protein